MGGTWMRWRDAESMGTMIGYVYHAAPLYVKHVDLVIQHIADAVSGGAGCKDGSTACSDGDGESIGPRRRRRRRRGGARKVQLRADRHIYRCPDYTVLCL